MGARQRVTILAVVLVAVAGMVAPAIAAQETAPPGPDPVEPTSDAPLTDAFVVETTTNETTDQATNESENETAPLGSQISAFMQSSSVAADESVESGMWQARFETANRSNQSTMIDRRTGVLETRLDELRGELTALNTSETPGLTDVSHAGRVASLTARINALESTLNQTSTVAAEAGVNHTRLDRLRENASSLNGRAVSEIARGLTVVENPGRGPPEDRGPPGDRNPGNGDGPGNGQGPPDGRNETESESGDGPGNGQGPPTDGNGTESERGQGSSTDTESSNGGPDQPGEEGTDDGDERSGPPGTVSGPAASVP